MEKNTNEKIQGDGIKQFSVPSPSIFQNLYFWSALYFFGVIYGPQVRAIMTEKKYK